MDEQKQFLIHTYIWGHLLQTIFHNEEAIYINNVILSVLLHQTTV